MMRPWHTVVLAALAAALAACPSPKTQGGIPPVPELSPVPRTGSPELCEVAIVPEAPPGKERLGTVQMPADPGQPIIVDPEARRVACGLGARWAVRQQAYVDASGQLMWSMELYAPR